MHEGFAIHTFAALSLRKPLVHSLAKLLQLNRAKLVLLCHEAQRFTHNFAGGVIAARLDLGVHKLF